MTRATALVLAGACVAGCGYYNGMWSAEHLAGEARKLERQDRAGEARTYWAQAAVKAESVLVRHPTSRWADAALVLHGEALARSGACAPAAAPLARAIATVRDPALLERARLARAECALDANDPATAGRALAGVTESSDAARRSRAAFDAGRVAALEGDEEAAAEWFRRSAAPGALAARVRALVAAGRVADALEWTDTLAHGPVEETAWAAMLIDLRRAAGLEATSRALDRMLAHRQTPRGVRARLWSADGDALLAGGRTAAAAARYAAVVALVPDSSEGQVARVRALRVLCVAAESVPQLAAPSAALERLLQGGGGVAQSEGQALIALIRRIAHQQDRSTGERFQLAEAVRDSLGAARLAGRLFLELARQEPASLFAPKALVAAAALEPERHDSLVAVLDARYATSPYTLALRGEQSPGFAAAEDSLATALGLAAGRASSRFVGRVALPVPGPRGPPLDGPVVAAGVAAPPPPARPERPEPPGRRGARPVGDQDERPAVPRDTL
ncbi:MAG TPA: hypothetical protein VH158_06395 [Gemmatimonadales bacterium]|nr:hypothetical protein [Gemmatimonadales bacterium]